MSKLHQRGRPAANSREVNEKLLEAAQACAKEKSLRDISAREIANRAGVTQAMINYYFQNKDGLYVALLDFLISDWEKRMSQLVRKMSTPDYDPIPVFMDNIVQCLYEKNDITKLLVRELEEGTSIIPQVYWERLSSRITQATLKFLKQGQKTGIFRNDIDPYYLILTINGMSTHPLSLKPSVLNDIFCTETTELSQPKWRDFMVDCIRRLLQPTC